MDLYMSDIFYLSNEGMEEVFVYFIYVKLKLNYVNSGRTAVTTLGRNMLY